MEHNQFVQLYGGIIAELPDDNIAKEADHVPKARRSGKKKAAMSPNNEDDGKKGRRGRPRVDPQDQSAVERRRTQIRLAQRAYRERKETTISVLEQRVAQLQQTVRDMNQAFLDYNDKALSSGAIDWNPVLGEDLKETMQQFIELARNANVESDTEETGQSSNKTRKEMFYRDSSTTSSRNLDQHNHVSPLPRRSHLPDLNYPASMLGYDYDVPGTVKADDVRDTQHTEHSDYQESGRLEDKWNDNNTKMQQYRAEVSNLPVFTQNWNAAADIALKPTWTYSFQESTFSRRLLRAAYERAYYILTNPHAPKGEVYRLLRFTFHLYDIQNVIINLRAKLMKSTKESLENWSAPIWHLGGAGLHFSRVISEGEAPLPDGWQAAQPVGPHKPRNPEICMPEMDFPHKLPEHAEVEGVWFDCNDVEQYLRTKGLFLDGQMAVAEIEVDDQVPSLAGDIMGGSPYSLSSESFGEPQSPCNSNDPMPSLFPEATDYFSRTSSTDAVPASFDAIALDTDFAFSWPVDGNLKSADALHVDDLNIVPALATFDLAPQKRKVHIDVDKLLAVLTDSAICLGRAPGYRPEDVDAALSKVLQEAF